MMVEMACLYTSCECPSRRSSTQKLSNQVTTPCSLTPFTKKIVSGILFLRTWLRKVSCRFCARSAAMAVVPFFVPRAPTSRVFSCPFAVIVFRSFSLIRFPGRMDPKDRPLEGASGGDASPSWAKLSRKGPSSGRCGKNYLPSLGIAVKFLPQRHCDRARSAIPDRAAVDAHHRHHDLGRRGDEGLSRGIGLFQRERPFFDSERQRLDDIERDGAGDTAQDGVVGLP